MRRIFPNRRTAQTGWPRSGEIGFVQLSALVRILSLVRGDELPQIGFFALGTVNNLSYVVVGSAGKAIVTKSALWKH